MPFTAKPPTFHEELRELRTLFNNNELAGITGLKPESISRATKRASVRPSTRRVIDDLWYVVFLAWERHTPDVKFFLMSRQPELHGAVPTDLVREEKTDEVVDWLICQLPDDIPEANLRESQMFSGYDEESLTHEAEALDPAEPLAAFVVPGSITTF